MNNFTLRVLPLGLAFVGGLALGEACTSTSKNGNHCSYLAGNATCAERYGDERPYCGGDCVDSEGGDGCVAERPTADGCYYPCGDDMTAEDDMSCSGSTSMTDTVASTLDTSASDPSGDPTTDTDVTSSITNTTMTQGSETDPTETTGPGECDVSSACTDPSSPICEGLMCIPCTMAAEPDLACSAKDEATPICNDDGACVQCNAANASACEGTTPICDVGASTCVGCTVHEQCEGTACDIATGACFDDACVRTVDGDGGADFDNLTDAIADGCVITLYGAATPYFENPVIDGITVAILAAEGERPRVQGDTTATLVISNDASVYLQGIVVSLNGQDVGLRANGSAVYLDRCEILQNADGGIDLQTGASGHVRNCFVGGNGSQFQDHHGIVASNAMIDIVYSTIVANDGNGADSLACSGASGSVRDSILVGSDPSSVDCPGVTFEANAIDEAIAGNNDVGPLVPDWFVNVPDLLHLGPEGEAAFADLAVWNTGDPPVDIDGDLRPDMDGTSDYAGADRP